MSTVERVARALCRLDGHPENATMDGKPLWQDYLPEARVAIEAMREPDMAMISAAVSAAEKSGPGDFAAIWHAMLTAALGKE